MNDKGYKFLTAAALTSCMNVQALEFIQHVSPLNNSGWGWHEELSNMSRDPSCSSSSQCSDSKVGDNDIVMK